MAGRHDEAIEQGHLALELEPTSTIISRDLGLNFTMARRFPEAIIQYQKTIELDPSFARTHGMLASVYWYNGMIAEAIAQAQNLDDIMRRYYEALGRGDNDEAVALIDAAVETGFYLAAAALYANAGAKDKSLDVLEEAVRQRIPQVLLPVASR